VIKIKNKFIEKDNYIEVYLDRRNKDCLISKIDKKDFPKIYDFPNKWFSKWNKNTSSYYAVANNDIDGNRKTLYMHRFIANVSDSLIYVDHKNHDTLDNRSFNLRLTKNHQNSRHRIGKNSNNTSGYRNVSWNKYLKKWVVQLQVEGSNKILGKFDNVHEAGKFAEKMREIYYGKFKGNG